jgi:hypothetical protein
MGTNLASLTVSAGYHKLLTLDATIDGASLRTIGDGDGTSSCLKVSSNKLKISDNTEIDSSGLISNSIIIGQSSATSPKSALVNDAVFQLGDDLVITNGASDVGLSIVTDEDSASGKKSSIILGHNGSGTNFNKASIEYDNNSNNLEIKNGGNVALSINSSGVATIKSSSSVTTLTANANISSSSDYIIASPPSSSAIELTLPASTGLTGRVITIVNISRNSADVKIKRNGNSEKINTNATELTLGSVNANICNSVSILCTGTTGNEWQVISSAGTYSVA